MMALVQTNKSEHPQKPRLGFRFMIVSQHVGAAVKPKSLFSLSGLVTVWFRVFELELIHQGELL